jgi:uncharacterized membrane protein YphA (DoxX/SURF4 family)
VSRIAVEPGVNAASAAGRAVRVAHVDYVTDEQTERADAASFLSEVLSDPFNLAVVVASGAVVVVGLLAYLAVRPTIEDIVVLRETLAGYGDLVPWMLRLSAGLPLIGAGFQGYLFAPTAGFDAAANPALRLLFIGLGFTLLFGLAIRTVAAVGIATYAWSLTADPSVVLAVEYLPILLSLVILGAGRPSADDMLLAVAAAEGTYYGRVDPVHRFKQRVDAVVRRFERFVPVVLRVGMGASFVYLGAVQKLASPTSALSVVEKYGLTAVVPVDPGLWVLGAGVAEIAVGVALVFGAFTRGAAAVSFGLFTLTLFGLPDDPVLAHVALFGLASAVFTLGAGPLSFDNRFGRPALEPSDSAVSTD